MIPETHPLYKRRPPDEELSAALQQHSYKEVAAFYKVSMNTVKNWVTRAGLARVRRPNAPHVRAESPLNKKFPGPEALQRLLQKHTQEEVAQIIGVARSTICVWVNEHGLFTRGLNRKAPVAPPPRYTEDKVDPLAKRLSSIKW